MGEKKTIVTLERRSRLLREMTVALAHALDQDAIRASQILNKVAKRPLTYYMEDEERNYEEQRQLQTNNNNNTGNMLAQKFTESLDNPSFYGSNSMEMTDFDGGGQVRLGPGETFEDFANNNFLLKEQQEILKIQSATDQIMQRILQNREEITSSHKNKDRYNNDSTFAGSSLSIDKGSAETSQLDDWGLESSSVPPNKMASDIANRILSRLVLRGDRDGN